MLSRRSAPPAALILFSFALGGLHTLCFAPNPYGGMVMPIALAALCLFALYLALYPALAAALWRACSQQETPARTGWQSSLLFASVWTLAEWLRGAGIMGFPWLVSGYAQVDGPFAGYAAFIGVYGISGLLALS